MSCLRDFLKHLRPLASLFTLLAASYASAQSFLQPKVVTTGNWPKAFYAGDFDGDGNQDLLYLQPLASATAGQPDTVVYIVYGDGKGNFSSPLVQGQINASGGFIGTVADMNADGIEDFIFVLGPVAPSLETSCFVWFGNSQRSMPVAASSKWLASGNGHFGSILVARLTQKSPLGLFLFDTANNGEIFFLNGFGVLQPYYDIPMSGGTGPVAAYDLNGDGNLDLVVLSQASHSVDVYLGTGYAPPFQAPARYTGASGIYSFLLQDVTFDGRPDLIAEGPAGRIDVFPGDGDGTFQSTSFGGTGTLDGTTGNGGHLIAVADLNHDGLPDALAVTPAGVSVLLGNGTAYLGLNGIYNAGPTGGSGHPSYVTADFNHDDNLDLAVDSPEGIAILFGNPDGTFQTSRSFASGQPAMAGATGVFTSSGNVDAVVSINSRQAQLLAGQGDGTFVFKSSASSSGVPQPTTTLTGSPGLWSSLAVGDFNGDGLTDIAVTADGPANSNNLPLSGSGLLVQYGLGDGTFVTSPSIVSNTNPGGSPFFGTTAAAQSFGTDGGIGLTNLDPPHLWSISAQRALPPAPVFAASIVPVSDKHAHNLVVAGALHGASTYDVVAQDQSSFKLYLNAQLGAGSIAAGDLAEDGSLTTPGQLVAPDISGTFPGPSTALGFNAFPGSAIIADLDRDGNNDLLITYANLSADRTAPTPSAPSYLYIWFGSGNGKFLTSAAHPVNPVRLILSRNYYQVATADLNGDSIPDLILSDGYILSVQLGIGDGTFGPETHFLAGQGLNTISVADLNHDGKLDLVVANGGTVFSNPVANLEVLTVNPDVSTGGVTVLLNQVSAPTLIPTTLSLVLCVDPPGSNFPCAANISSSPLISPITMFYGQVLDGAAIESENDLTGTLNFFSGPRIFCTLTANLSQGANTCPAASGIFPAGTTNVYAAYSGDATHASSTSNTILVSVLPDPTTASLTSSLNASTVGQSVTFTTSIQGNYASGAGPALLYDGSSLLAKLILDANGNATFTTSALAIGTHPLRIVFPASSNFNATTSLTLNQIVNPLAASSTVSLNSSINPSALGQSITFSATVTVAGQTPGGTLNFLDGATILATAPLNTSGLAVFTTSALAVGSHPITASYAGSTTIAAAVSPVLSQIVTQSSGFTLNITPTPVTLGVGRTAVLLVSVTEGPGYSQPIQLTCTGLPIESTCTLIQPLLPVGGASTTLNLTVSAPRDCGTNTPYFLGSSTIPPTFLRPAASAAALACLLFLPALRRRKLLTRTIVLSLLALTTLLTLSGCGHCTDLGTRPGTYSFTVTATPQGGPAAAQSQTIPLTVTIP